MEPPPNLNRPALHNPLPTPPQQIHDNFNDKETTRAVRGDMKLQQISSPARPQEKEGYTPPSTIFRKRSHDEAFESNGEGDFTSEQQKHAQFGQDFELYSSQSVIVTPEKAAEQDDDEASITSDGNTSSVDNSEPATPATIQKVVFDSAGRKMASYRTWEARHPVVTPAEQYNRNPLLYAKFLLAEARETKALVKLELDRKKAKQDEKKKKTKTTSQAVSKQPAVKRRRVEERQVTPIQLDQHSDEDSLHLTVHISIPKQKPVESRLATPPITPQQKPRKERARSNSVALSKSPLKKKVNKANKVVKRKPGKPGGINEHMDAIKATLNARLEKAGKAKQKNAPELFTDAYIPPMNLDGRVLVDPSREVQPKVLDVNDPSYGLLHPTERLLAERVRATPSEYVTQKRRYFLGLGEWWRLGHESVNPSHAQSFCNQDGNNTSYMHRVYDDWGWSKRALWSDELLESMTPLTACEPWARK